MERPPNIRHLAALVATVRHGTITRAAAAVNLTQPALTQAIARLERDLDCALFDREPGGMRAAQPALLLARRAETAIARIGSPRVTATQMRAFLALARSGSYAGAAAETGLTPTSLHRAVADLSLALGERLVERRGRAVILTRRGAVRAGNFGLALADLRSGLAELAEWLGRKGSRVIVGAMPLSRARWLPLALARFNARIPAVEVSVIEGSHDELAPLLRSGEVDFLLGAIRPDEALDDLEQDAIFEDRPQIAMRSGHPLARSKTASALALLRRYDWVLPSVRTPLRNYWQAMMAGDGGAVPPVAIECGSVLTIRELLLQSDRLSLLSRDQLRVEIEADLIVTRPPPTAIARTIGITTRRDWHPTVSQRQFLDILRELGSNPSQKLMR